MTNAHHILLANRLRNIQREIDSFAAGRRGQRAGPTIQQLAKALGEIADEIDGPPWEHDSAEAGAGATLSS